MAFVLRQKSYHYKLKRGEIYYYSDHNGPRFIKIIKIGDIWNKDDTWVCFWSSPWLGNVVFEDDSNPSGACVKQQNKKWYFDKLLRDYSFNKEFRGCIKIPDFIINSILENKKIDINLPYMSYSKFNGLELNDRILCKSITKEDYRDIKMNSIFN